MKEKMRSDYYLNKGIEKLQKHLDVTKIIRCERNSKIFQNVLFDRDEQFLTNYQKAMVIDSSSSSAANDLIDQQAERKDKIVAKACLEDQATHV